MPAQPSAGAPQTPAVAGAPPRDYLGSLAGTPVFLGCSNVDPHIPLARVRETTMVLSRLGGSSPSGSIPAWAT